MKDINQPLMNRIFVIMKACCSLEEIHVDRSEGVSGIKN